MPTRSGQRFRRWRRYLHISVRGMIALVVVIALGLAWGGASHVATCRPRGGNDPRVADGSVKYNWEYRDGESVPNGSPPAPQQIVEFVGVDHFGSVTAVELFPRSRPVRDFSAEDRAESRVRARLRQDAAPGRARGSRGFTRERR